MGWANSGGVDLKGYMVTVDKTMFCNNEMLGKQR